MDSGFQYGDIIFLALVAAFVVLRLRSVLGRRIGFGSEDAPRPAVPAPPVEHMVQRVEKTIKAATAEDDEPLLATIDNTEVKTGIAAIRAADPTFSLQDFLRGAKGAFEMVLGAFTRNDKDMLKMLLSPALFDTFTAEIEARQAAEEKHETTLVSIKSSDITEAAMKDKNTARIAVKFISEQVHVTRDAKGTVIAGDVSAVVQVEDHWVFERDIRSKSPNWAIVAT